MSKIKSVKAQEILTTSGIPTIETTVVLDDGMSAISSVPLSIAGNTYAAFNLEDKDMDRFEGKGVLKAIETVNNIIAPKIVGLDSLEQQKVDKIMLELDGTQNKIKLGANSMLSVSQAVAKAGAKSSFLPLSLHLRQFLSSNVEHKMPTPIFSLIEGGSHASNNLSFQEFLAIPATNHPLEKQIEIGTTIYNKLRSSLKNNGQTTLNTVKAGFGPSYRTNNEVFANIKTIIESTNLAFLKDVFLGADIFANSFFSNKKYYLNDKNTSISESDTLEFYQQLFNDYSLVYFEDAYSDEDLEAWKKIFQAFSQKSLIVGDSLTATNIYRLQQAISQNLINAVVIKPGQVGTVTESLAFSEIARFKQLKIIVSDRSIETTDTFIADFAVAINCDYVKFGAPARERAGKYNRLMAIEKELAASKLI